MEEEEERPSGQSARRNVDDTTIYVTLTVESGIACRIGNLNFAISPKSVFIHIPTCIVLLAAVS